MKFPLTSPRSSKFVLPVISLSLALMAALAVWSSLAGAARHGTLRQFIFCLAFLGFGFIAGFAFRGFMMMASRSSSDMP